jgi:hypothetical protein
MTGPDKMSLTAVYYQLRETILLSPQSGIRRIANNPETRANPSVIPDF